MYQQYKQRDFHIKSILVAVVMVSVVLFIFMKSQKQIFNRDREENKQMGTIEFVADHAHLKPLKMLEILPGEVVEKMQSKDDFVLLDVRTQQEYDEFHIEDSVLVPIDELSQESLEVVGIGNKTKEKDIIIYCRSGARSERAYHKLVELGYRDVKSVAGGILHWQKDNYPFIK